MVGKRIGEVHKGRGEACRVGGDEFCAYLADMSETRARLIAEEVRLVVAEECIEWGSHSFTTTISIGVASSGPGRSSLRTLLAAADEALYRAKAAGRNCVSP